MSNKIFAKIFACPESQIPNGVATPAFFLSGLKNQEI
jgi:hypothetical protein